MVRLKVVLAPIIVLVVAKLAIRSSTFLRMQIAVQLMGWSGVGEIAKEAFATRWIGTKTTASRTEFLGVLDALAEADTKYLSPTGHAVVDPVDIAEGHKYLTHLLRTGLETLLEQDSDRPSFRKLVAADRKILGDNPDAIYYASPLLDRERAYLVRGRVTSEDYFSLTVYHTDCEGCFFKDTIADLNHFQLKLGPDRSFEVLVSNSAPPAGYTGDFMSLGGAPAGDALAVTFAQLCGRRSVQAALLPPATPPQVTHCNSSRATTTSLSSRLPPTRTRYLCILIM